MRKRRCLSLGLLVSIVWIGIATTACRADSYIARERVKSLLEAWQKGGTGGNGYAQAAITIWAFGGKGMADGAMSDQFDDWRRAKDLYRPILLFEINKVRVDASTQPPTAYVTVTIDGKIYKMKVVRGRPIEWAD